MQIRTKEHYDILTAFEKSHSGLRFDKEPYELWSKGVVYQNGEVNKLYGLFMLGYSTARTVYMQEDNTATVISSEDDFYHFCSKCNNEVYKKDKYCHTCGCELKWGIK